MCDKIITLIGIKERVETMEVKVRNRLIVTGALLLLLVPATVIFSWKVLLTALIALITSFLLELANAKIRKESFDYSGFTITPLIVTLMLTPYIAKYLWMVPLSLAFGLFFAKYIFGGQDKNIFNPAALSLIFAAVSFPTIFSQYVDPTTDILSADTPATLLITDAAAFFNQYTFKDLLLGNYAGGVGTTFKLGIVVFGLILIGLKVVNWRIPVFYLLTYFMISNILYLFDPNFYSHPFYYLFVGHLLFAVFFMATDPVTAPMDKKGIAIYGIGLGFFTFIIQRFSSNVEGTIYAVIFMNALVGLIDAWTMKKSEEEIEEATV